MKRNGRLIQTHEVMFRDEPKQGTITMVQLWPSWKKKQKRKNKQTKEKVTLALR